MMECDYPTVELTSDKSQSTTDGGCTRCPICGKVFYLPDITQWAYKVTNNHYIPRYMCSWTCLNKAKEVLKPSRKYKERY